MKSVLADPSELTDVEHVHAQFHVYVPPLVLAEVGELVHLGRVQLPRGISSPSPSAEIA